MLSTHESASENIGVPEPFTFEFEHEEQMLIGDEYETGDEVYDIDDNPFDLDEHVRRKRKAKWSPDYDLYGQWAEEYYASYETPEEKESALEEPRKDILDKLMEIDENKTEEEKEQERVQLEIKKERLRLIFIILTWAIGIIVVVIFFGRIITNILAKIPGMNFCKPSKLKKIATQIVNAFVPGVYIHPNGRREFYMPTQEELEALEHCRKLLMDLRMA